jgi:hypothetical protein
MSDKMDDSQVKSGDSPAVDQPNDKQMNNEDDGLAHAAKEPESVEMEATTGYIYIQCISILCIKITTFRAPEYSRLRRR